MSRTTSSDEFGSSGADRLASVAHEAIDRIRPEAKRVEHDMRDAATEALSGAKLLQERAADAVEAKLRMARSYAETNPLTTASIAFATGVLLGALFRR